MYDAQYMQHAEAYARVMNELYDINSKLKEVLHLPFMYCNHSGCNETVKLPAQYCAKHTPFEQDTKASDLTIKVDVDKVSKSMNTKKTTK